MSKQPTKLQPLEVKEENPFEGDALNREELCKTLTHFIENSSTPFVFAVDAEWGNGKTVFLQMWRAYLKKKGFKTVFFDAWSCDFHSDALPALIGEIQREIEPESEFKEKAKTLVKLLPSATAKAIIGRITGETGKEIVSRLIKGAQEHDKIQNYIDYREAVDKFKDQLGKVAKEQEKPLVIFIDELDRCRPTFAVEVLEKVKHIFDVEGIFFVVGLNKREFINTVQSEYGKINGDVYLQKFFDMTMLLKNDKKSFFKASIGKANIKLADIDKENFYYALSNLCYMFEISLREQEQILPLCYITLPMANKKTILGSNQVDFCLFLFFVVIRVINPDLFREIAITLVGNETSKSLPYEKIESFIEKGKPLSSDNAEAGPFYVFVDKLMEFFFAMVSEDRKKLTEIQQEAKKLEIVRTAVQGLTQNLSDPKKARERLTEIVNTINVVELEPL